MRISLLRRLHGPSSITTPPSTIISSPPSRPRSTRSMADSSPAGSALASPSRSTMRARRYSESPRCVGSTAVPRRGWIRTSIRRQWLNVTRQAEVRGRVDSRRRQCLRSVPAQLRDGRVSCREHPDLPRVEQPRRFQPSLHDRSGDSAGNDRQGLHRRGLRPSGDAHRDVLARRILRKWGAGLHPIRKRSGALRRHDDHAVLPLHG
jgi:hypothetical protein